MKSNSFETYAKGQMAVYSAMLDFIPVMRETARKFDGKVINARFAKALEEASPKTHIGAPYYVEKEVPCFYCAFTDHYRFGEKELTVKCMYLDGKGVERELSNQFYCLEDIPSGVRNRIYGEVFHFDRFDYALKRTEQVLRDNIEHLQDEMENFDRVCDEYAAIYEKLKELSKYRSAFHHVTEWELRDVKRVSEVSAY